MITRVQVSITEASKPLKVLDPSLSRNEMISGIMGAKTKKYRQRTGKTNIFDKLSLFVCIEMLVGLFDKIPHVQDLSSLICESPTYFFAD